MCVHVYLGRVCEGRHVCVCLCSEESVCVCVSVLVCVYVVSCGSLRVHFCMCVSGRGLLGGLCDHVSV